MKVDEPQILYHTEFLDLKQAKVDDKSYWYYAHRPNVSNVVLIAPYFEENSKKKTILLETRRPPLIAEKETEVCIELPAGLVGDIKKSESTLEAIKKELLEETGFQADEVEIVFEKISSSAGCTSEIATLAIAKINNPIQIQKPINDGGVIEKINIVDLDEILYWLSLKQKEGKMISAQMLAGIFALFLKLKK